MRPDIAEFPAADEPNSVLGHDGTLTDEEVKHLTSLGYFVAHWKSFSGNRLVQAYFEGLAKGLIPFDDGQIKAMEAIRKLGTQDLIQKDKGEVSDIMSILQAPFRSAEISKGPLKKRKSPVKPGHDDEE